MSPPPPMVATNSFEALLLQYVEFLKKFVNERVVLRLVHNRVVVRKNLKFHTDLDTLLREFQLPEGNEDWRPQWEKFRDVQAAAFQDMSRQKNKLIGDLDRTDTHAQTEALGLLLYEYSKVTDEYTPAELKVLNNAFTEVSRFSKNKAPTISTWFLPPYQFEVRETAFAFGGYGNVHYGKHCGTDVAVKCVTLKPDADRAAITVAFVKEANLWFKANNIPNVVRLFGAYHLAEKPYFVSEYAVNGTLKSYLFKEENRHQVWKLLLDAANGIRALHQLRILHNDLKCD
ncbi:Tkl protein kinase, partial [Globisporangium polare]